MRAQSYLFFDGRCEEAIEFYTRAVGAELQSLMRFKESPDPSMHTPGNEDKVIHAEFRVGETTILASDGQCTGRPSFQGFALTVIVKDEVEAERTFTALSEGGHVQMPLTRTFFSAKFGMLADRFGVSWMVYVAK